MTTETKELCSFLSDLSYDDLPQDLIHKAKASILNALGCALGDASCSAATKARNALVPLSTAATSTVLGRPEKTDFQTAAFLNGIAFTNSDYDDTHLRTVIHPSGTVLSALLSLGEEKHISGKELVLCFVVGCEAQLRVGVAISPGHYEIGWHVTGTTGTFGAAAAISKLLGLSAQQFFFAFGHATSLSAGTRSSFGSDTKTLHMGRGAQNGIVAAFLAEQDFDTGVNPIEYWGKLVSPTVDVKSLTADLGNRWELSENTFKPYPCGIVIHPLIDGGIKLHEKGITSQQLVRLEVRVNPQCVRLCSIRHPSTQLEAVFSLYHGCAVGLLYGKEGRKEVSAEICNSKEVAAIRDKIEVTTDVRITDDSAQLKAILRDGSEAVESIEHAKGSLENPLTKKEIEVKFVDQAEEPLGLEKCQDIMTICWNLEKLGDVSSLTKLCSTG